MHRRRVSRGDYFEWTRDILVAVLAREVSSPRGIDDLLADELLSYSGNVRVTQIDFDICWCILRSGTLVFVPLDLLRSMTPEHIDRWPTLPAPQHR